MNNGKGYILAMNYELASNNAYLTVLLYYLHNNFFEEFSFAKNMTIQSAKFGVQQIIGNMKTREC